ncbi:hypothetical protein XA68_18229 [Ophiocordyceps unilateralis]|uniref:Uncharacterized protein n=1 Tax=Ophiocordyceps unilateralis TaxID=268505 RepID=A0A2A9PRN9_OPHUN|nr:hypothetical protein XA68_18229 [Ophiocordyceps unilateralis]
MGVLAPSSRKPWRVHKIFPGLSVLASDAVMSHTMVLGGFYQQQKEKEMAQEFSSSSRTARIVETRALNSVAIPDAYPMPIPAEMVHKLAGRKYISAVDARSFFHQFLVHRDHRERFTVVSHRGLERSCRGSDGI